MVKVYYLVSVGRWPTFMEGWFHWFSALGYLNSSLNFFIYSAINKKFRSSFRRLIGFKRPHRDRTWMLPPRPGANNHHGDHKKNASFGCRPFRE